MKLRTAMLAGTTLLVAAIIAATVIAVVIVLDRSERRALGQDLDRSHRVFQDLLGYRQSVLHSDCRVVANEPRLRALVATQDISRETVVGVVAELRSSLGSDLFLLTDARGTLVADALDGAAEGFDLSTNPVIAAALAKGEGGGVWITDDRPYQTQACRIDFGAQTVGIIVIGRVFDDGAAEVVHRQTGSTLVVALDAKQVASTVPAAEQGAELGLVVTQVGAELAEVDLNGARHVGVGGRFPGYEGKRTLAYAVLHSLDEALAPGRRLMWSILGIAALSLLAALGLAFALSRKLSRPVDDLVEFTRRVARGSLGTRAKPEGVSEVKALATAMNTMIDEIEKSRQQLADKERLEKELEIATRIQTSMLPVSFDVHRMDIAARMIPASEVGGDYYDIIPVKDGCWIGVGDVAGHGLTAGLEMLMVQSVIAALVRVDPVAAPKDHLCALNHVIYENIRNRLGQDEHITLTLMRCVGGTVTFAGAHEEIIVLREGADACERIATPGTWLGAARNIERVTRDTTLELGPGDLMVLYSDGVTEARGKDGSQLGIDRLCDTILAARGESVEGVRDRVVEAVQAWQTLQDDDISVVVVRRTAE